MKNFRCIATFTYPHEYVIIRLKFEESGIRFFFQNETMIGLLPFYSYALGGIKLLVHPEDIEQAKEILDSFSDRSSSLRIV